MSTNKKNHEAAIAFPVGSAVSFQTSSRKGRSDIRYGVVKGHRGGERGTWVEIAERGAAIGVVAAARASLVTARVLFGHPPAPPESQVTAQ